MLLGRLGESQGLPDLAFLQYAWMFWKQIDVTLTDFSMGNGGPPYLQEAVPD